MNKWIAILGVLMIAGQANGATIYTVSGGALFVAPSESRTNNSGTATLYDIVGTPGNKSRVEIRNGTVVNFTDNGTGTTQAVHLEHSSFLLEAGATLNLIDNDRGHNNAFQTEAGTDSSDIVIGGSLLIRDNDEAGAIGFSMRGQSTFKTLGTANITVEENGGDQANGIGILFSDNAVGEFAVGTVWSVTEGSGNNSNNQQARLFRTNNFSELTILGGTYSVDQTRGGSGVLGNARHDSKVFILGGDFTLNEAGNGDSELFRSEDDAWIQISGGSFSNSEAGGGDLYDLVAVGESTIELVGQSFSAPFGSVLTGTGLISGVLADGSVFTLNYTTFDPENNDVATNGRIILTQASAVPEPATGTLALFGLVGIAGRRRRHA